MFFQRGNILVPIFKLVSFLFMLLQFVEQQIIHVPVGHAEPAGQYVRAHNQAGETVAHSGGAAFPQGFEKTNPFGGLLVTPP